MKKESVATRASVILTSGMHRDSRFIPDYDELSSVIDELKSLGLKVVMTKGVYDLLHVGHVRYISDAKSRGDILVVSIDTDDLTRARKGPRRPIVPQDERIEMLLHTRYVDIITLRSDLPEEEESDIAAVRPDILVTSATTADYTEEKKEGLRQKFGVDVVTLEAKASNTTTAMIRNLMIDGVEDLIHHLEKFTIDMRSKFTR